MGKFLKGKGKGNRKKEIWNDEKEKLKRKCEEKKKRKRQSNSNGKAKNIEKRNLNFKREINLISIGKYLTLTGQERSFPRQPSLGVGGGGMHCMVHTGIHSEEGFLEFKKY